MRMPPASTILMIRPAAFGYNNETAVNNLFQSAPSLKEEELQQQALGEFDQMVDLLKSHGIDVVVINDTSEPVKPDAIFPNNWISTSPSGVIYVFPMFASNRRPEKRDDILQWLSKEYVVTDVQDWSEFEVDHMITNFGDDITCLKPRFGCRTPFGNTIRSYTRS